MTNEEAKDYIREWCPYDRQEEIIKALEQEPCEDVIDRAEAMTEIMMFAGNVKSYKEDIYIKVSDAVQLLRELPPVNLQEPKTDVLDKIRAEIKLNRNEWIKGKDAEWHTYDRCLFIIDKYKAEKE